MRLYLTKDLLFKLQPFRRRFYYQVGFCDFIQVGGSTDMLQSGITVGFRKFSQLHSLGEITFYGLYPASKCFPIDIPEQNFVAGSRRDLGYAVAHGASANDAYSFNGLRSDAGFQ